MRRNVSALNKTSFLSLSWVYTAFCSGHWFLSSNCDFRLAPLLLQYWNGYSIQKGRWCKSPTTSTIFKVASYKKSLLNISGEGDKKNRLAYSLTMRHILWQVNSLKVIFWIAERSARIHDEQDMTDIGNTLLSDNGKSVKSGEKSLQSWKLFCWQVLFHAIVTVSLKVCSLWCWKTRVLAVLLRWDQTMQVISIFLY